MKLQILVPQYKETDKVIKPLLDSLEVQQNIDLQNDLGVIIVNDGSNTFLSEDLFKNYSFPIQYYKDKHRGVSGARNTALKRAKADYVMFCDADDMFYNACGLWIVFREIENGGFDTLVSAFLEETRDPSTNDPVYITHDMDSTFVHGKIHRRKYLLKNKIFWNEKLTIHEDSYFNILAQRLAPNAKYCPTPFYLWKWRDESVCRHDPKYILKTYNNMLDSNTALLKELLKRNRKDIAKTYAAMMIYDAYFTMNKDEWINQENKEYRDATEKRFKKYYLEFNKYAEELTKEEKTQIIAGLRNRFYGEGLILESETFDHWIEHIKSLPD